MRFPLTEELVEEAERYALRSACRHCFFFAGGSCAHEWPAQGQERWPLDAPDATGKRPATVEFCKEFELS